MFILKLEDNKLLNINNKLYNIDDIKKHLLISKSKKNTTQCIYNNIKINCDIGDTSIFFPYNDTTGKKIIISDDINKLLNNIKYIKNNNISIFPKIYNVEKIYDNVLLLDIEYIKLNKIIISNNYKKFMTNNNFDHMKENIINDPDILRICINNFNKYNILPSFDWYKKINLINNKIVDFQDFKKYEDRYLFPINCSKLEFENIHNKSLKIFKETNKWKGKLYQGFKFKNNYLIDGYSSDNIEYDSYIKMQFMPFDKCANEDVLDIGCNQGFYCYQAALHNAKSIIGVDIGEDNIKVAKLLNNIIKTDNINFYVDDAISFLDKLKKDNKQFMLIILSSVLHRMFDGFTIKAHKYLEDISNMSNYIFFETPVEHPNVKESLSDITDILNQHFYIVRLVYIYNAYSSGYRAIYICYGKLYKKNHL
jgi:hypothetical protein